MYLGSFVCGCCDVLERARLFAVVVWAVKVGSQCPMDPMVAWEMKEGEE